MTIEQLRSFIAAADSPTFFDAADICHTTQSTISKQIASLEKELQLTLFSRAGRKAELTEAGRIFYEDAALLLADYENALKHLQNLQSKQNSRLRIGTLPFQAQYRLPPLFHAFSEENPQITLTCSETEEQQLLRDFYDDNYDMIILRDSMVDAKGMKITPLTKDRLAAVVSKHHPLSKLSESRNSSGNIGVTMKELANEHFLLMNPNTSIYEVSYALLKQYDLAGQIEGCARSESVLNQVAVGNSVGLLPELTCRLFRLDDVCLLPLKPEVSLPIVIAQKKTAEPSAAVSCFLNFVKTYFSENDHQ